MRLTENARVVLEKRYLIRDENGRPVEDVEGLVRRVSGAVSEPDKAFGGEEAAKRSGEIFRGMLERLDFLPNSPTLMNAGRPLGQLSACFVLPVEDSMEDIFEAIKRAALIHKSGGGTGFSFSRLRPKGSTVNTTGGVASGPVSFMRVFNMATEAVKQGGTRRGANMGILRVDHPDILEFIDCKKNNADITNFNISVGITEAFMRAAEKGEEYDLVDPNTKKAVRRLNAKDVFGKIVDAAWRNGEPGIIFLDRLNRDNVVPCVGEIESTNPCGEQPLLPFEACNLGSVNLANMPSADKKEVDWEKLGQTVTDAVHFLDNVIDANRYPLPEIDEMTKKTRKVGLGVMGWADLLLELGIPYNSDEAVALGGRVMAFIEKRARAESAALAKERGPFPLFPQSTLASGVPLRNATVTTIAPTGTLSIIAGCSSGVEPVFAFVFIRNVMDGTELIEVNPVLRRVLEERGLYTDALMKKIAEEGSLAHIGEIPEDIRRVFVCAHDISPAHHIRMQAAFQDHTDNAVSKTVNFPHSATRDEVREVYELAYRLGCKGVTIYRDGSRDAQVLNIGAVSGKQQKPAEAGVPAEPEGRRGLTPRPRPAVTTGFTEKVRIGCGNLYITVNYDDKGICEVFTNTGRAGGCPSQSEATARLVSVALRAGLDTDTLIEQLKGIRCPSTIRQPGMKVTSCPDAIARVIEKVKRFQDGQAPGIPALEGTGAAEERAAADAASADAASADAIPRRYDYVEHVDVHMKFCPECGQKLEHEGGCITCRNCGYSKCG